MQIGLDNRAKLSYVKSVKQKNKDKRLLCFSDNLMYYLLRRAVAYYLDM